MKRIWKRRRVRALASLSLLGTLLGVPILFVNGRLYRQNLNVDNEEFAVLPAPRASDRLLIFAPHCDDETLGCAGLMALAARIGAAIKVVVVTNGDASFSTALSSVKVSPRQHVEMAYDRQAETLAALKELGLSEEDLIFLGYPDGGTAAMWFDCWNPQHLFTSRFTRKDRSPYRNSFRAAAPYCGMAELEDIRRVMREFQPTAIYTTHPNDAHRDHWATHAFVTAALESLRLEGNPSANKARLYTYLIHRGEGWPAPKGYYPGERLLPPAKLVEGDTRWFELRLDGDAQGRKHRALLQYRSQLATMRKWMMGFVRQTELFGVVPTVEVNREIGALSNWTAVPIVLRDPVRDSFARDVMGQGDICDVAAEVNDEFLFLRVNLDKDASPRLVYDVTLHGIATTEDKAHIVKYSIRLRPPDHVQVRSVNGIGPVEIASDIRLTTDGKCLRIAVPRDLLGNACVLMLAVSSKLQGIQVDKTAYKVLRLPKKE
jgi:LmbE family N-acetylglucosaminyl deacetylase